MTKLRLKVDVEIVESVQCEADVVKLQERIENRFIKGVCAAIHGICFEKRAPLQPAVLLSYTMMALKKWKLPDGDMARGFLNNRFLLPTSNI